MSANMDNKGFESTRVKTHNLTVYYDGSCPLCLKEIGYYQRKDHKDFVHWIDASSCVPSELGDDLERSEAMRRFHVRDSKGSLISGGKAFAEIWKVIPGFQRLGELTSSKPAAAMLDLIYAGFLKLRPSVQRLYRRFDSGSAEQPKA
ncbi:MAG: DUF393 domain-containing protein [Pseudomonadota bacterium]